MRFSRVGIATAIRNPCGLQEGDYHLKINYINCLRKTKESIEFWLVKIEKIEYKGKQSEKWTINLSVQLW